MKSPIQLLVATIIFRGRGNENDESQMKPAFVIAFSLLVLFLGAGCSTGRSANDSSAPQLNEDSLGSFLAEVDPWPSGATNYPDASWALLQKQAQLLQGCKPAEVENVLRKFQLNGCPNGEFQMLTLKKVEEDGKLFLLIRVMFELPEAVVNNGQQITYFGAWMGRLMPSRGQIDAQGRINIGWPVKWNSGHPILTSGWLGMQGVNARYNAAQEYNYFRQKYKMRDLKSG